MYIPRNILPLCVLYLNYNLSWKNPFISWTKPILNKGDSKLSDKRKSLSERLEGVDLATQRSWSCYWVFLLCSERIYTTYSLGLKSVLVAFPMGFWLSAFEFGIRTFSFGFLIYSPGFWLWPPTNHRFRQPFLILPFPLNSKVVFKKTSIYSFFFSFHVIFPFLPFIYLKFY